MAAVAVLRNETLQAFLQVRARKFTFDDFLRYIDSLIRID